MNYGASYSPNYAQQQQAYAQHAARQAHPLAYAGPAAAHPLARTGQEDKKGIVDTSKEWLDKRTWKIQRKYLLGGAAGLGVLYYLYQRGTFGKPRRFAF